jgi:hypothetical protein
MSAQRPGRGLDHSNLFTSSSSAHTNATSLTNVNENNTYVFYNAHPAYDYLTQLPTPQHELMFGGGLVTGVIEELGNVNDAEYSPPIASHLSGALSVYFGERNWGEEAHAGDKGDSDEGKWSKGRVKALWSGIEGVSADELPWVGRLPHKVSGRKQPTRFTHGSFSILHNRIGAQDKDEASIATDASSSPDSEDIPSLFSPRVTLAPPGEWIAAGYSGEGMVHAWMSGKALAHMVLGHVEDEWFPNILRVTEGRWKKAKVENLMNRFLDS